MDTRDTRDTRDTLEIKIWMWSMVSTTMLVLVLVSAMWGASLAILPKCNSNGRTGTTQQKICFVLGLLVCLALLAAIMSIAFGWFGIGLDAYGMGSMASGSLQPDFGTSA